MWRAMAEVVIIGRVLEVLTNYLNTRYGKKFGQNIKVEFAAFYYHYP